MFTLTELVLIKDLYLYIISTWYSLLCHLFMYTLRFYVYNLLDPYGFNFHMKFLS